MTTLYVASTGGHLNQLKDFAARVPLGQPAVWVTHDNAQSRSLLAAERVEYVPYVGVRSVADVLRCVPHAHRMLQEHKFTRAMSTGSGIALAYLPYLAARGVECHYIESATRVIAPSLTGRILQHLPKVHLYTQYERHADDRWHYGGNIFDRYRSVSKSRALGYRVRVVVTVGIATGYPFRRLITQLIPLLSADGELSRATGRPVKVLWQTAGTPCDDLPIDATSALPSAELSAALAEADIVISHAGTGSATTILGSGRYPVLVPRRLSYGEAGDEHQTELATELAHRDLCRSVEADAITVDDLLQTLSRGIRQLPVTPHFELQR